MNKTITSTPVELFSLRLPDPISLNHFYRKFRDRMVISPEGRAFKQVVTAMVKEAYPDFKLPKKPMGFELKAWLLTSEINRRDWDGLIKAVQDAIFEAQLPGGATDAWVYEGKVRKYPLLPEQNGPFCTVKIWTL
jgi:Holliday junction resolvase RusA-like endonuclease